MTFQGPTESDSKMAQNLTVSQRKVIFGVILESLFLDPESHFVASAKTDPVRFKWGFGEALSKDRFAYSEAYKNPIPKKRKPLAKRPCL